jgi:hypothetical protein
MGRYSMPTPCFEALRALGIAGGVALAAVAAASPCAADAFLTQLLAVADVTDPAAVSDRFSSTFGDELARHTRVFVSAPLDVQSPNDVVRFVRVGDEGVPLDLGVPGRCVSLNALAARLKADGWSGGRTAANPSERWMYRKGRTQLTAHAATGAPECSGEILLTFRRARN